MTILSFRQSFLKKIKKPKHFSKAASKKKGSFSHTIKVIFWFSFGVLLGFFFFTSFLFIYYQKSHENAIYEGVFVNDIDFGGKSKNDVRSYFAKKNDLVRKTSFLLSYSDMTASISASEISFGYDENLLAQQAYSIGRSKSIFSNLSLILQAYTDGIRLPASNHYKEEKLNTILLPLKDKINIQPVNAKFTFENGKVSAFGLSNDGKAVDINRLKQDIIAHMAAALLSNKTQIITLKIPVETIKPEVNSDNINSMGVKELIASGTSLFQHSIENRAYNIQLAASKINGTLIPPNETFSFVKTVGDISNLSGYKQAYVIENGKTVLGDGGGVCQVSTTLFRAALNAGLPIVERHPHAYRVGYYEEDSPPGIDAAVYVPTVDLKFKNDTGHYILIQSYVDLNNYQITFELYGTKDDRQVTVNHPVILSESPAPDALYQDDPTLPKGQIKQIDFAAGGANVYFTRTVIKDGKTYLADKFVSNYRPWQAIYMRGTGN